MKKINEIHLRNDVTSKLRQWTTSKRVAKHAVSQHRQTTLNFINRIGSGFNFRFCFSDDESSI
jgi:hypothetical protein